MTRIRIRVAHPRHVQYGERATSVPLSHGLPEYADLVDELLEMTRVLTGHQDMPVSSPYLALMEVATAYHTRAREIEMLIYRGEQDGSISSGRGSTNPYYKLRTGMLQAFIEMAKRTAELGSRRLTQEQVTTEQRLER